MQFNWDSPRHSYVDHPADVAAAHKALWDSLGFQTVVEQRGNDWLFWAGNNGVTSVSLLLLSAGGGGGGGDSPPATPQNLVVDGHTSTNVTLSWDASAGADFYNLYFKEEGGSYALYGQAYSTSGGVYGLSPETHYFFKITAENAFGVSGYSSEVSDTTGATPIAPSALLLYDAISDASYLSWTDNDGHLDRFEVERYISGAFTPIGTTAGNVTIFSESGLTPDSSVLYRVRGVRGGETTDYATSESGYMASADPSQPAGAFWFDTMTGASRTALASHTGELGATYTQYGSPVGQLDGKSRFDGNADVAKASGTPADADYTVSMSARISGTPLSTCKLALRARWTGDNTTGDYYEVRYHTDGSHAPLGVSLQGTYDLYSVVGGSETLLGTWTSADTYPIFSLTVSGTTITVKQFGSTVLTVTDSSISAAGKAGFTSTGNSANPVNAMHVLWTSGVD